MSIPLFRQRVIEEKHELDEKIAKLRDFNNGSIYLILPDDERGRLTRQYLHMIAYAEVLSERIKAFEVKPYEQA